MTTVEVGNVGNIKFDTVGETRKATLSLAKRHPSKKGETMWLTVEYWGKIVESVVEPYVEKGKQIQVVGELMVDTWEKDGQKNYKTYIKGEKIQLLSSKGDSAGGDAPSEDKPTKKAKPKPVEDDFDLGDDELPPF